MNRAGKMPAPLSGSCLNDSGSCIRARNSWEALAGSAGVSPPVCGTGTETVPETAAGTAALRLRTVRGEHRPPKNERIEAMNRAGGTPAPLSDSWRVGSATCDLAPPADRQVPLASGAIMDASVQAELFAIDGEISCIFWFNSPYLASNEN